MPMYDRGCIACDHQMIDCWEPITSSAVPCAKCGEPTERVWLQRSSGVIGDECDVLIEHGLCYADGSPRRFRSKAEIVRVAKEEGLVQWVEHKGEKGSDKSRHTSRWV